MKRILFVSPTGTLDNGAEKSTLNLMRYLGELGHQIFNVFPKNEHPTYQKYLEKQEEFQIKPYPIQVLNWWWEEAPGYKHRTKQDRAVFYRKNISDIRTIIIREKIDVVVSVSANVFEGAMAALCEGTPHVWMIHEFPREEFSYYKEKLDFIIAASDNISCVRGNLYQELSQLVDGRAEMSQFIPYSSLVENVLQSSNDIRLVSIGKINDNKNQFELLKAYEQSSLKDYPLLFIGDWEETSKEKLDRYIAEHQLDKVLFLGFQDNPWDLVSENDICVFNSKSESFSLVYLESILNGVPAIISDNDGYKTVHSIFQTGQIYQLGNEAELVTRLEDMVSHFSAYKEESLLKQARAKELYTLKNCYNHLVRVIETVAIKHTKAFEQVENLFLSPLDQEVIDSLENDKLSIFYLEDGDNTFTADKCITYPLELSGSHEIPLADSIQKIRVDIGEKPGEFHHVFLEVEGEEIEPIAHTAIVHDKKYLFSKPDPQIFYDLTNYSQKTVVLNYQIHQIFDNSQEHFLLNTLSENLVLAKELETIQKEKEDLEQTLSLMENSKRWQVTSQIINLFRRNK